MKNLKSIGIMFGVVLLANYASKKIEQNGDSKFLGIF